MKRTQSALIPLTVLSLSIISPRRSTRNVTSQGRSRQREARITWATSVPPSKQLDDRLRTHGDIVAVAVAAVADIGDERCRAVVEIERQQRLLVRIGVQVRMVLLLADGIRRTDACQSRRSDQHHAVLLGDDRPAACDFGQVIVLPVLMVATREHAGLGPATPAAVAVA